MGFNYLYNQSCGSEITVSLIIDANLDNEGKSIALSNNGDAYIYNSIDDSWSQISNFGFEENHWVYSLAYDNESERAIAFDVYGEVKLMIIKQMNGHPYLTQVLLRVNLMEQLHMILKVTESLWCPLQIILPWLMIIIQILGKF